MEQHRRSRKSHPSAVEGLIEDVICGRYKRRDEVKEPVTISHSRQLDPAWTCSLCMSGKRLHSECSRPTFLESSCGQLF